MGVSQYFSESDRDARERLANARNVAVIGRSQERGQRRRSKALSTRSTLSQRPT